MRAEEGDSQGVSRSSAMSGTVASNGTGEPEQAEMSSPPSYVGSTAVPADWLAALARVSGVGEYKRESYALLAPKPGETILDLGCGRGDDVRALASLVAPGGTVTGVDANPALVHIAQAASTGESGAAQGVIENTPIENTPHVDASSVAATRFLVARGEALPFEAATFDAVRIDRVLQHVEHPVRVLREARRVLRPGGRLVVVEPDWRTVAIYPASPAGGDDDTVVAALLDWHIAHTVHPLVGRCLGAFMAEAGFSDVESQPRAYASRSVAVADLVLELSTALEGVLALAPPPISSERAHTWLDAARQAEASGVFMASLTLFFTRGVAPSSPAGQTKAGHAETETRKGGRTQA